MSAHWSTHSWKVRLNTSASYSKASNLVPQYLVNTLPFGAVYGLGSASQFDKPCVGAAEVVDEALDA